MELAGQIAVVTGSARGIGKTIAMSLAEAGANIVVSDLNVEAGKETVGEIEAMGREAIWVQADVSKSDQANQLIESAQEKFGRLDILVNNAGITRDNLLMRMSEDEWDSVIAVNLKGTYNCIRAATKIFMKQRAGRIINIASVVGQMGNAGQANYASSKAGVIGLTKSVAKELAGRNILVNAVAPGFIETAMTERLTEKAKEALIQLIPLAKLGQPEDVAKVVLFLSSERSSYITGQVINVDGGMVM
jgi:3-oxoacyl-[acyl-carrier protein] reductase